MVSTSNYIKCKKKKNVKKKRSLNVLQLNNMTDISLNKQYFNPPNWTNIQLDKFHKW